MNFEEFKNHIKNIHAGKHLPDALYLHKSALDKIPASLKVFVVDSIESLNLSARPWTVLKLYKRDFKISLLNYPEFYTEAFPSLESSYSIDLQALAYKKIHYKNSKNPPILHRKETLLDPENPKIPIFKKLTEQAEKEGLFEKKRKIGFKNAWEKILKEKGLHINGHSIVKEKNQFDNEIHRHKTAIDRYSLSTPVQSLYRHNYLNGEYTFFDYGCGKGDDLNIIKELGVTASGWDPVYRPEEKLTKADIVNLGFVVNIIESLSERTQTLKKAYSLSKKILVASVMLGSESITSKFKKYGDGVITSRNTFQKYYTQNEFRDYIENSLGESAIAVGPGLFYIFRDKIKEQQFLIDRQRQRKNWKKISYTDPPDRLKIKQKAFYARHKDLLDDFWESCLELGRLPLNSEYKKSEQLRAACGSHQKALTLLTDIHGKSNFEAAESNRRNDLLVHFALSHFSRRKPYNAMPKILQKDIKYFFNKYTDAIQEATDLLFSVGNTETIKSECQKAYEMLGTGRMEGDHSWTIHIDYVNQLSPTLRTYIGCATQLYGDLYEVDLIKIHMQSNKVSLMRYDDFEGKPLPLLMERIKINLREQKINFYTYGEKFKPQPLYIKSQYIGDGYPNYDDQFRFDEKLSSFDWLDLSDFGLPSDELSELLDEHGIQLQDFKIKES
ncbi:DNA phosphorothioation-associated putative methyltransferase [uncultured Desulfobacter sp.]|uniref:DNA phosphorothioation-associated putative methyltransferase n=1 Tax=uncultured Desulfobacter sp. TaxID=240139 RepID=UPI0029C87ED3|nr:DNA phosphorothioation-associated putative methyltransferase [uncultured Desulfobacter sp.]